jgi:hypothetical protein
MKACHKWDACKKTAGIAQLLKRFRLHHHGFPDKFQA